MNNCMYKRVFFLLLKRLPIKKSFEYPDWQQVLLFILLHISVICHRTMTCGNRSVTQQEGSDQRDTSRQIIHCHFDETRCVCVCVCWTCYEASSVLRGNSTDRKTRIREIPLHLKTPSHFTLVYHFQNANTTLVGFSLPAVTGPLLCDQVCH